MIKQKGAAVLMITVILLVMAVLIVILSSNHSRLVQQTTTNQYASAQAFQAAEAGLSFGLQFLNANKSTVTDSASGGVVNYGSSNSNLTNVTLANNSKYSVTYTNPTAGSYNLMRITSVGTNADNTATTTMTQLVYQSTNYLTASAMARGAVTFVGGSQLYNTITNMNIQSGGAVTINNGAVTYTSGGQSSSQGNIKSDIQQNQANLATSTESAFFQNVFGTNVSAIQSSAQSSGTYYNNTVSGGDYSQTLKNITGKTIYINQTNGSTVTLGQGVTIGSASNPVTLVVTGNLNIANGVTIYGFVYSSAPSTGLVLAGGARIYGGIASGGKIDISNGFRLDYTKIPILAGSSSGDYTKVPGTWRDF